MMALDSTSFAAAAGALATRDSHLASVLDRHGVPPFWHRPPGFATLCLFIVEQQVSLASAKAVFERVHDAIGGFTPANLLAVTPDRLGEAGLTRQKQRYLINLAQQTLRGEFALDDLGTAPDDQARAELVALVGIGPWTADVYLLSALRRPDIWPVGDRALQVGVGEVMALGSTPTSKELETIGDRWKPFRSVAARLIWHNYLALRERQETEVRGI